MKLFLLKYPALHQLIRYGVVGVLNNTLGYLVYLFVTYLGLDPKITITILYPLAAIMAYFSHMKYSFAYQGRRVSSLLRYILAYAMSYGLNLMMLSILCDKFQMPHQLVQAIAIPCVAVILFLLLRYFVFSSSEASEASGVKESN